VHYRTKEPVLIERHHAGERQQRMADRSGDDQLADKNTHAI
jgi:hypothetical protein